MGDLRDKVTTLAAQREREALLMKGIVSPPELDLTIPRGRWFIDTILMKCFAIVLVAGLYWSAASKWGWPLPW
jgi:hypothetical protein